MNRRLEVVLRQFGNYFQSVGGLATSLDRLMAAGARGDEVEQRRQRGEIGRLIGRSRDAARAIQSQDRRLLARRTDLPESFMDQLDRDAEALGAVAKAVRSEDPGALRHSSETVRAMLERWRALLTFGAQPSGR